jgi:formylglycine-generating enzyme required for sulfatase activity
VSQCGADGDSCCTTIEVPGGTYYRNYYVAQIDGGLAESDPATVSDFRMDKYLVTVGRFRAFVNALFPSDGGPGWTPPPGSGIHTQLNAGQGLLDVGGDGGGTIYEPGWSSSDDGKLTPIPSGSGVGVCEPFATWTDSPGGNESLPINCVTWYEAYGFCIWDGGFLPSEGEWGYVAAGGSEQRAYPWGSVDAGGSSLYAIYGCYYPSDGGPQAGTPLGCSGFQNIAPVGMASLGAGRWRHLDLAGEEYEWTLDWYADLFVDPCTDCVNLQAPQYGRVFRGASFHDFSLLATNRNYQAPASRLNGFGIRCARAP